MRTAGAKWPRACGAWRTNSGQAALLVAKAGPTGCLWEGRAVACPSVDALLSRHYWQLLTTTPRRCSAHDPNGGALAASVTSGRRWQQLTGPAV